PSRDAVAADLAFRPPPRLPGASTARRRSGTRDREAAATERRRQEDAEEAGLVERLDDGCRVAPVAFGRHGVLAHQPREVGGAREVRLGGGRLPCDSSGPGTGAQEARIRTPRGCRPAVGGGLPEMGG